MVIHTEYAFRISYQNALERYFSYSNVAHGRVKNFVDTLLLSMVMAFGQNIQLITLLTLTPVVIDLVAKKIRHICHRSAARGYRKSKPKFLHFENLKGNSQCCPLLCTYATSQ